MATAVLESVVLVGTSAGVPTAERNVACTAVKFRGGDTVLVDCGEGTQHQFLRCPDRGRLRRSKLRAVLVTHLHGDHVYGLPGLLATTKLLSSAPRSRTLVVVGPRGLRSFLAACFVELEPQDVCLVELEPGQPATGPLFGGASWHAFPVVHTDDVAAFCYVLAAAPPLPPLDAARALALGAAGPQLGALKAGRDVVLADGRVVRAADVLGAPPPQQKVVVMGDNEGVVAAHWAAFAERAAGCDVLVDECTFTEEIRGARADTGHSSPEVAAKLALDVGAQKLVLTHFSQRVDAEEQRQHAQRYVQEHAEEGAHVPEVLAGEDFMEVPLPHHSTEKKNEQKQ